MHISSANVFPSKNVIYNMLPKESLFEGNVEIGLSLLGVIFTDQEKRV